MKLKDIKEDIDNYYETLYNTMAVTKMNDNMKESKSDQITRLTIEKLAIENSKLMVENELNKVKASLLITEANFKAHKEISDFHSNQKDKRIENLIEINKRLEDKIESTHKLLDLLKVSRGEELNIYDLRTRIGFLLKNKIIN